MRVFCGQDLPFSGSPAGKVHAPPVQSSVASVAPKIVPGGKAGASKTDENKIFVWLDCGQLDPNGVGMAVVVQTCFFDAQLPFAPVIGMHTVVANGVPKTMPGQFDGVICVSVIMGVVPG